MGQEQKLIFEGKVALVIDDESLMRRLIAQLLTQMGFADVISVEDGAEGLRLLENHRNIDLVISDLDMPMIGGLEFISMLRNSDSVTNAQVPIVVVSGHSEERYLRKAVNLGIHGFVVKPISYKSLEARVRHALEAGLVELQENEARGDGSRASTPEGGVEVLDFNG